MRHCGGKQGRSVPLLFFQVTLLIDCWEGHGENQRRSKSQTSTERGRGEKTRYVEI